MSLVGIEKIAVHIPRMYVDQQELALKQGWQAEKITKGLGLEKMAVPEIYEDPVTMAANAAQKLFQAEISRNAIGRLVVATESGCANL